MKATLLVCNNFRFGLTTPSCAAAGSGALIAALRAELDRRRLPWEVVESFCMGYCGQGPNLKARGGPMLHGCKADQVADIVDRLLAEWTPGDDRGDGTEPDALMPIPGL